MKNIYSRIYNQGRKLSLINNPRIKVMLDIVNKLDLRNKNILDIGCYDGTFLSLIENRNNNFYGIDANDYAVRKAKEKGINVKKFFFNDESKIPFENNFFDLIIAGEIIEHIYDTDFFLDEIYRLLKKDGFLILSTPNLASFGRRLMLLLGINPIIECSPNEKDSSGHIRYFTFKTLEHLLRKHRFNIVLKRSDLVNFTRNGKIKSYFLANNIKSIGQSIVCFCDKQ